MPGSYSPTPKASRCFQALAGFDEWKHSLVMSDEASLKAYEKATDSAEKFDYFIAAITGAIVTYSLQSYRSARWDWDALTAEPIGLILLFFSFFLGMLKIQSGVSAKKHNHAYLEAKEHAASLDAAWSAGVAGGVDPITQQYFHREQFPEMQEAVARRVVKQFQFAKEFVDAGEWQYHWRNRLLLAGFGALFVSKVLAPYWQ